MWLGYGERDKLGLEINHMVKNKILKAPIVIGRDHLDTGSVASPYRETEGMRDGSDAIADWPILNGLLNTASGASWVSVHHGGGVGIGYSIHAGQVLVCDGTENMDKRIERVLTNDPGIGIARHYDAGYDEAIKHGGSYSVSFLAIEVTKDDQARLTQRFVADRYRGKRVRFSGYMKTNMVNGWAGLWMRVDTVTKVGWAFDDMEDREAKGTTDWKRYQVVLDVPQDAAAIYLGAHLFGRGQVWVDDCAFEVVGDDVPATDGSRLRGGRERNFSIPPFLDDEPVNLDFEETETL